MAQEANAQRAYPSFLRQQWGTQHSRHRVSRTTIISLCLERSKNSKRTPASAENAELF